MQHTALRHRAQNFMRTLSTGISTALQSGWRQQLTEAQMRSMRLIHQQHCIMRMAAIGNRPHICRHTVIIGACQQHRLNFAVLRQRRLYLLHGNLHLNSEFRLILRLQIDCFDTAQNKSAGNTAVRITWQQQLFPRVQRCQQHGMNCLARAVDCPKAGITAVGLRCQLLRFFNIGFRLMDIVQLAHQRHIHLHAATKFLAQQALHAASSLMSGSMQRIDVLTFILQHRLYQRHANFIFHYLLPPAKLN